MIEYLIYFALLIVGIGITFFYFKAQHGKWAKSLTNAINDKSSASDNSKLNLPNEFADVVTYIQANKQTEASISEPVQAQIEDDSVHKTQLKNLIIVNELGQRLTSSLQLDETFQYLFSTLNSLMDAAVVELGVYNNSKDTWAIYSNLKDDENPKYKNHIAEWVQTNNREVNLYDGEKDYGRYVTKPLQMQNGKTAQTLCCYPILLDDQVAGTITVVSYRKNAFDSYQIESIMHLLGFLSVALQNAITHEEVNILKIRAEESEKHEQQFLANMSHEIRTPMNAVLGMTNLLLGTSLNEKQIKYLNAINVSSKNLLVIINDILDLSKIEAGKMSIEKIPFRIKTVIENVSSTSRFKAEEKGLNFEVVLDNNLPEVVMGDPTRLNQILTNLISNAVKFTEKGSVRIAVEIAKNNRFIQFKISDSGIGIPEDKQHLLFGNFKQVDASTYRKYGGTGLGLAISKTLIELQGGKVDVKSVLGQGSEFIVNIPYEIGTETQVKELNQVVVLDSTNLSGIKILVAEDNEYNQIVVTDTLTSLIENVSIDIAENGIEAVQMQESNNYDIILMDAQMPEMDGIDATKAIRNLTDSTKKTIPIIALTASVHKADIDRCFVAGMNGFVPKPFTPDQLLTAIAEFYHNTQPKEKPISDNNETKIEETKDAPIQENGEIVSLTFLREFVEGNLDRMKKYIGLYLKLLPDNIVKIGESVDTKDSASLIKTIHAMRPHLSYMGMEKAAEIAAEMESIAQEEEKQSELFEMANVVVEHCKKSKIELEMLLPNLV